MSTIEDSFNASFDVATGEINSSIKDTPQTEEENQPVTPPETPESEIDNLLQAKADEEPEKPAVDEQSKLINKKYEFTKKLLIDNIEEKFEDLRSGKIDKETLKEWFDKKPEMAEIANRSKRIKEEYRLFTKDIETEQAKLHAESGDLDEKISQLVDQKLSQQKQQLELERKKQEAIEFASQNNIKDDNYKKLLENASALQGVNKDWSFRMCLEKANLLVNPIKPKGITLPMGMRSLPTSSDEDVDLTKGYTVKL